MYIPSYFEVDPLRHSFLKDNHSPSKVAASLITPYFYVNVASDNIELQNLFKRLDARALQVSYKI